MPTKTLPRTPALIFSTYIQTSMAPNSAVSTSGVYVYPFNLPFNLTSCLMLTPLYCRNYSSGRYTKPILFNIVYHISPSLESPCFILLTVHMFRYSSLIICSKADILNPHITTFLSEAAVSHICPRTCCVPVHRSVLLP